MIFFLSVKDYLKFACNDEFTNFVIKILYLNHNLRTHYTIMKYFYIVLIFG